MEHKEIFSRLWKNYVADNPSVGKIVKLLHDEGELIINDHIALRTFDFAPMNIEMLEKAFLKAGYARRGSYRFEKKKLRAIHYEHITDQNAPRVFISELICGEFSLFLRKVASSMADKIKELHIKPEELIYGGQFCQPLSFKTYDALRQESEYAAWLYAFGLRANHFTVSINYLSAHNSIVKLNKLLKQHGFPLNRSGGEIKGTKEQGLMQSSTLADKVEVEFLEDKYEIPCSYYEFAQRFELSNGKLFNGFIADSADKIFESTDMYK